MRLKNTLKSELEKIELIGKKKVDLLFEKFKSIDKIRAASVDELAKINGIGKTLAENIYKYFHKNLGE